MINEHTTLSKIYLLKKNGPKGLSELTDQELLPEIKK
jgi:hypothetical protein